MDCLSKNSTFYPHPNPLLFKAREMVSHPNLSGRLKIPLLIIGEGVRG